MAESLARNCGVLVRGAALATAAEYAVVRPSVAQAQRLGFDSRTAFTALTVLVHAVLYFGSHVASMACRSWCPGLELLRNKAQL